MRRRARCGSRPGSSTTSAPTSAAYDAPPHDEVVAIAAGSGTTQFVADLAALVAAVEESPGLASRSPTKWRSTEAWLADALGVSPGDVRTTGMEDAGDFTARRGQIARADPRLAVVVVQSQLDRITERAREFLAGRTECVAVLAKDDDHWVVKRLVATPDSDLASRLAHLAGVEDADVVVAGGADQHAVAERPQERAGSHVAFTRHDCALLAPFQGGVRWRDLPEPEAERVLDLRDRLRELAEIVADAAAGEVELAPFVSRYVVRGGNAARDLWCCVYPRVVANKSYALQVAFIVMSDRTELCFCLGRASAQERDPVRRAEHQAQLEQAKSRLGTAPTASVRALEELLRDGYVLRDEWRKPPDGPDFASAEEWLAEAARRGTGGMSVSRYYDPEALEARGGLIVDDMRRLLERVRPLLDHVYGSGSRASGTPAPPPSATFDLESLHEECSRTLRLSPTVYANLWAALESGKHVILTGPPGTGKTTVAQAVADLAARAGRSSGWVLTTATADWTTYETIGGLKPTPDGLEFEPGHFLEAIVDRKWLVIDELNRSNFDRAFGQLFTVLSRQPVVLPYRRPGADERITLVPHPKEDYAAVGGDQIEIPPGWRIVATMNVFDKSLLYEMSYALMRRFAFVEVPSPDDAPGGDFEKVIEAAARDETGTVDAVARSVALDLMKVRAVKDIGPASFIDVAEFVRLRQAAGDGASAGELAWHAFYGFLLPQFEGIDEREGRLLYRTLVSIAGQPLWKVIRVTLSAVLGLSENALAPGTRDRDDAADADPDAGPTGPST